MIASVVSSGIDRISDFAPGTDKIITTGTPGSTGKALSVVPRTLVGSQPTLDAALAANFAGGPNATTTAFYAYTFTYGGKSYLLIDNGGAGYSAGTDSVVEITGTPTVGDIINQK